ncbi:1016_t:CDS:2, partial [Cetraspora pellucida]
QGSLLQIDDSEYEIIDYGESSKEQSDDSLPHEKDNKPLRINRLKSKKRKHKAPLNISCKKKERAQIQYTSLSDLSEADSDKDESTSSDANDITKEQKSTTINEIEKNKALLLKNNFEIVQKNQLIVYGDKLFAKNRSIEDLLITDFSHLFNDTNVINFLFLPLPSYSTNIESLGNYFKKWAVQYSQLKNTKTEVEEKMLKLLYQLRGAYLTLLVILAEENERNKKMPSSHKALHDSVKKKVKSILRISERHEQ